MKCIVWLFFIIIIIIVVVVVVWYFVKKILSCHGSGWFSNSISMMNNNVCAVTHIMYMMIYGYNVNLQTIPLLFLFPYTVELR